MDKIQFPVEQPGSDYAKNQHAKQDVAAEITAYLYTFQVYSPSGSQADVSHSLSYLAWQDRIELYLYSHRASSWQELLQCPISYVPEPTC